MQTAIRSTASGSWNYPDAGVPKAGYHQRSEQLQKDVQAVRGSGNDFLTTVFSPLPISEFMSTYSEKNYMYLYDSAKNYAGFLGKAFTLKPDCNDFQGLYTALNNMLPKYQELELEEKNHTLIFSVLDNREDHTLYYIPCEIIDQAEGILKDIYSSFFYHLQKSQRFNELSENTTFECLLDELPDPKSDEKIDPEDDWLTLLNEYSKGKIADTLNLVSQKPKYDIRQLKQCIESYKPQAEKESQLLELMQEGLRLFKKGCIMDFAVSPLEGDEYYLDHYPVEMSRMMHLVYSTDDLLFSSLFEWVSNEANESGYEFLSSGYKQITPNTRKLVKVNTYVELFMDWLNRLCYEL